MKYIRIFRVLSMAVILSLLVMAVIPATPALAARQIELDPEEGQIDDEITITGSGFSFSHDATERFVDIYFGKDEGGTTDDIGDDVNTYELVKTIGVGWEDDPDEGEFDTTFTVPERLSDGFDDEDVEPGTYYLYATDYNFKRIRAVAEFTVVGEGDISIDPNDGPVGTEVEISGSDFGDREDIVIEYDGDEIDIESGDDKTDSDGDFEATIIIPESKAGDHTIKVIGEDSLAEVEDTFTVEPEITISPTEGSARSTTTVSGTGFDSRSNVVIDLDGTEVATDKTDSDGNLDATFEVPDMTPGTYDVDVEDEDNNSASAEFPVIISISASINPISGHVGTEVTVTGTGYLGGTNVSIKYDTTEVATATAGTDGSFTATFKAPLSQSGAHDVTVSDGATTEQFTFTMESEAPLTPQPLLPEMGIKPEQPVHFDWADATDASPPVTYSLQIATSQNFAASSIVLKKEGLTESDYTLTEREELAPASQDEPYYWRARAVDAAGNESDWTGIGEFYVGGAFAGAGGMPTWLKYLLIALGVLLLGVFAFWLGKKAA